MPKISSNLFCKDCKQELRKITKGGNLQSRCIKCASKNTWKWIKTHPKYRQKRNYYSRETWRERFLKRRYGLTKQDYEALKQKQHGVCAICFNPQSYKNTQDLVVDHNHQTNKVRSLLCTNCNLALGLLKEDKKLFLACIAYLEKYE